MVIKKVKIGDEFGADHVNSLEKQPKLKNNCNTLPHSKKTDRCHTCM